MSVSTVLKVSGMTCTLCSLRIDNGLQKMGGIIKVAASYASEKVRLEYDPSQIEISEIKKAIQKLGFSVVEPDESRGDEKSKKRSNYSEAAKLKKLLIASAILTSPMILMMLCWPQVGLIQHLVHFNVTHGLIFDFFLNNMYILNDWRFQLPLATIVQFIIGARFYKNAWQSLKAGAPNMDVLVAVGTSVSYFYTIYQMILFLTNPVLQKGVGC